MAIYKLYCLGHPFLDVDGKPIKLEMRKSLALLVFLRMSDREYSRESLSTLFWPEYDQQHAQANLRRVLSSLNVSVQKELLEADREKIGLKDRSKIWLDIEQFHTLLTFSQNHTHSTDQACLECLGRLEEAKQLYRGDFLDGFNLGDCPEFDEWQFGQRESLRKELGFIVQKLSENYACQSKWETAITYGRRWVELDHLHEPAHRALMNLYARAGQRSAALRQYEELAHLLKAELGQPPEIETRQLYEQIRGPEVERKEGVFPARASSFPLLKTKLYLPSPPENRVRRSNLARRLDEAGRKALTLISAPAGFGKTTLLAEWIAQTSLPVAWLSLDNGDNDPSRFLDYVIEALECIREEIGVEARQMMQAAQSLEPPIILASLINDLSKTATPVVLILDDYQFITSLAVHDAVAYLLDHLSANVHIMISTRIDPPLQLGRLRVDNQLLELRAQDMRFDPDESIEFLNGVMHLDLTPEDTGALVTHTEGWVVGLKMAALSMQGRRDASEFVRTFTGSHRYVLDYLVEEVLKRQPDHIQTFLLMTSILDKLNCSLCDSLMAEEWKQSSETGQAVLEYLEKSNLFLIPLDENKGWYRYHHLFADLLQTRLRQYAPRQEAVLHQKAALWHAQNSHPAEAIQHALASKNMSLAATYIEEYSSFFIARSEISTIQNWIHALPAEIVHHRPWIILYQAWIQIRLGQLENVDSLISEVERTLAAGFHVEEQEKMADFIQMLRTFRANLSGDADLAIHLAHGDTAAVSEPITTANYQTCFQLGYARYSKGDLETAEEIFRGVAGAASEAGDIYNTIVAQVELAGIQGLRGKLSQAAAIYTQVLDWMQRQVQDSSVLDCLVKVGLAAIEYEMNHLEAADRLVQEGIQSAANGNRTNTLTYGLTIQAYINLAGAENAPMNLARARASIDRAVHHIQAHRTYPRTVSEVNACLAETWLAEGKIEKALTWARQEMRSAPAVLPFQKELEYIAVARVYLVAGEWTEALDLLQRLEEQAIQGGRSGRLIKIHLLQAIACQGLGKADEAFSFLVKSLTLAAPEGYVRPFVNEGTRFKALLLLAKTKAIWGDPGTISYAERLSGEL